MAPKPRLANPTSHIQSGLSVSQPSRLASAL